MTDTDPEGVLTPDELTPDDDRLEELDEDRYVVSVEQNQSEQTTADAANAHAAADSPDHAASDDAAPPHDAPDAGDGALRPAQDGAARLPNPTTVEGAFALAIDADFDGDRARFTAGTNDVAATFGDLLAWYADAVAPDVPTDEAVAVLLTNTDLDLEVEPR
jgi:hypothetical protein